MSDDTTPTFEQELEALLNRHSLENGSDTPDFLLARYLRSCLITFDAAIRRRDAWYGRRAAEDQTTDAPRML